MVIFNNNKVKLKGRHYIISDINSERPKLLAIDGHIWNDLLKRLFYSIS